MPDIIKWDDAPTPQGIQWDDEKSNDPLKNNAAGYPARDETPVTIMDQGKEVTIPAWANKTPEVAKAPEASRFDFMADTANLRPDDFMKTFGMNDEQLNALGANGDAWKYSPSAALVRGVVNPAIAGTNALFTGAQDAVTMLGRAITGTPYAGGSDQTYGEAGADLLPALGLEATHIPETYLTPARQADITQMIKSGASTDDIMAKHPSLDRTTVDLNVRARDKGWNKGPTFKAGPAATGVDAEIPDDLSGKRPAIAPPTEPTKDTVHVDPIPETDDTGTYHPINIRDPKTGNVTSAGRAYVDPDTGAPAGSVLSHPLTKENHVVTPETQSVIESKLPMAEENAGDEEAARIAAVHNGYEPPEDSYEGNKVTHNNTDFFPANKEGDAHFFDYHKEDGTKISGYFNVNKDGNIEHVSVGNPWARGDERQSWSIKDQKDFLRSIAAQYPDADTFSGKRVSGAREQVVDKQGNATTATTDLNRFRQKLGSEIPEDEPHIYQPGFTTVRNSDPSAPSHSFTYETPNGKVVKGTYDLEDNVIHSVDIGDTHNPVQIGTGETLNLVKQLAKAHPEADKIEGLRISGANPNRTMSFDADRFRNRGEPATAPEPTVGTEEPVAPPAVQEQGKAVSTANPLYEDAGTGTNLTDGNGNGNGGSGVGPTVLPEEPIGPHEPVSDKYASSINKDKITDDQDVRDAYDAWARSTPLDYRDNFDSINEKTKDYLSRHNDTDHPYSLFDGPVDKDGNFDARGQAPWSEAVRIQSAAETTKIARSLRAGEEISDEALSSARAINGLAKDSAYGQGSAFRARQRVLFDNPSRKASATSGDFGNGLDNDDIRETLNTINPEDKDAVQKVLGLSTDKEPGIVDLIKKTYISGLVSNLANHVKIYGGMLGQYGLNFVADTGTSLVGQAFRGVPGMERLYGTQIAARAIGFADGFVNALSNRVPGLFSDESSGGSFANMKSELMNSTFMKRPGYNTADLLLTAPLKLLHATGGFVNDVLSTSYLWDEAARVARTEGESLASPASLWQRMSELRNQPTAEMLMNADKQTKIDTFRDEMGPIGLGVSGLAQGVEKGINKGFGTNIPVSTLIAPFNGIVDGVMRAGVRWGPLALADRYNIQGLKEGGLAGQKTIGRLAVAAGLTGLLMQYVVNGDTLNGANPVNGGPPNSIKVGDNWYSIKGQSAIADNALLLANARDALKENKDTQDYASKVYNVFKSMASTVLEETTIRDLTPFLAPMDKANGEYRLRNYVTSLPVQAVPYSAALREYTRSSQPYETDTISPDATQEAINKVKAIIPKVADSLPARLDIYGRPMPSQSGPFKPVPVEKDPSVQEVNRLNEIANKKIIAPAGKYWTAYDEDDTPVKVKFTPEQLREYQQRSGDYIRRDFQNLINSPEYSTMSDKERIKALHGVISSQRANVRDEILDRTNPIPSNTIKWDQSDTIKWDN